MARRHKKPKKPKKRQIGRDAVNGQFISVKQARRRKRTATVEHI